MALGAGKYNAIGELVMAATGAQAVMIAVFGGINGSGFEVQALAEVDQLTLAQTLEEIAAQIRADAPAVAEQIKKDKENSNAT